jgi:hypothetical protein
MNIQDTFLTGKRILFISPKFFKYEEEIQKKMTDLGAIVDFYDEKPFNDALSKIVLKIAPFFLKQKLSKHYKHLLLIKNNYDFVFIIKCGYMSENILKQLKDLNKTSKFILYLWDSVVLVPGIKKKFKYFDSIFTFDRIDSKNNPMMKFRPLFFLDEYNFSKGISSSKNFLYDVCFIGTLHSDRYTIIKKLNKKLLNLKLNFFTNNYLPSKFVYLLFKVTRKNFFFSRINEFSFTKLTKEQIRNILQSSKCVLDIEHPSQDGLTMRTIEMIGMRKKIVTTNQDIINYDFYDSRNIYVLSRKNPFISIDFLNSKYAPIKNEIYKSYTLYSWLSDIFNYGVI